MGPEDSLAKRYFVKLISNSFYFVSQLAVNMIIPRGLGPVMYGNFDFLTNFFRQSFAFFDSGSSIGFYTKLSQRPNETALMAFYFHFIAAVALLTFLLTGILLLAGMGNLIWPGQKNIFVFAAAFMVLFSWVTEILGRINDAIGITVKGEQLKIAQSILSIIVMSAIYWSGSLSMATIFAYYYFVLGFLGMVWIILLYKNGVRLLHNMRFSVSEIRKYASELYQYSHPLFVYSLAGFIPGILDRWVLQHYSGSFAQGMFSIAYKIAAIAFFFTGTMTQLLTREFAKAHGTGDVEKMRGMFMRFIPLFYALTAMITVFLALNADAVIWVIGGAEYGPALWPVIIMCLYPIHQTYGQLSGSVFFSTGKTGLYRNIGVSGMLLGLPVTYLFLAPSNAWGMELGALGLAIKVVLLQALMVNIQLWFNCRHLNMPFGRFLFHQVVTVCTFAGAAFVAVEVATAVMKAMIGRFIFAGFIYTPMVAGLIYAFPFFVSSTRGEIAGMSFKIYGRLKGIGRRE